MKNLDSFSPCLAFIIVIFAKSTLCSSGGGGGGGADGDADGSGDGPEIFNMLPNCSALLPFQYNCTSPEYNSKLGTFLNCTKDRVTTVSCKALPNVVCLGSRQFEKNLTCRYTTGHQHSTALGLSIFFGNVGLDRFYLGYYGMGLLKLSTFGFFIFGNIVDIVLIATQRLPPADGSDYIVGPNGPKPVAFWASSDTYLDLQYADG